MVIVPEDWFYYTVVISIVVSMISQRLKLARNHECRLFSPVKYLLIAFCRVSPRCQIWNCLTLQQGKPTVWIINQMTGFLLRKNWSLLVYSWANVSCKQSNCFGDTSNLIIWLFSLIAFLRMKHLSRFSSCALINFHARCTIEW